MASAFVEYTSPERASVTVTVKSLKVTVASVLFRCTVNWFSDGVSSSSEQTTNRVMPSMSINNNESFFI